ncbi:toprim domain-containing protein [Niveispirillum sp.]|uniref:toprim domain-containing protein n=1 Tax=Niveispirillum sp. TaxID=1917217 RepID=UPI001B5A04B7|nr:toprim domain-containing protein [Niveispirillum sp.]MBP7340663.1 AAA family ATPase [Niveispirillum sp.]
MTTDVMKWLQEVRRLDAGLLREMRVAVRHVPGIEGPAAVFPYIRNGETYAGKFRGIQKKDSQGRSNFRSTKDVVRGLYNIDALSRDQDQPVVITEGEIDALSVIQSGFIRAVSLPDGWTAQGNKTEAIVEAEEALRRSPYVIVAGDNDEAGESLPRVMATILSGHDVRYAIWPEGCKDANDVLVCHGEGVLAKCLNEAKRIDPPGGVISGFSDMPPMSAQRVLRIGKEPFDKVIALEIGEISVWTGLPGAGKSTLTIWTADEVSIHEKVRVGLIGFETHAFRIRDQLCRAKHRKAFRDLSEAERDKLLADLDARWRLVHTSADAQHHLGWLESMVKTLAIRDRCRIIIIDPWNELEHLPEKGESMTNYINFAIKTIRSWAKALECHIAIVAHPAKMRTDQGKRPPTGYDIADSAAFFNKPGLGITVHEGKEEGEVEIYNWKTRDRLLYGTRPGRITAHFAQVHGVYRATTEAVQSLEQSQMEGF